MQDGRQIWSVHWTTGSRSTTGFTIVVDQAPCRYCPPPAPNQNHHHLSCNITGDIIILLVYLLTLHVYPE